MYPDSEILFPASLIPNLRDARPGLAWQKLIDRLSRADEHDEQVLAFTLMMVRLNNCLTCDLDSYRATIGCLQCSRRTLRTFRGKDEHIAEKLQEARNEVHKFLKSTPQARRLIEA